MATATKRRKVSAGTKMTKSLAVAKSEDHVTGAIVRVKMQNFMIYDDCVFKPGPYLNVLIGPNGTGKSTIVCAICLGLGGKTGLLGRSKEVGEFVKYGRSQALLEVELSNPAGNTVIRREIVRQGNASTWYVNKVRTTYREVEETVANHNIQLANLCQFLPQDKVVEFAKMSKQELLESTEKSVGQPELHDYHQTLKDCRRKEKELILGHKEESEILEKLRQKNIRLEADVQRFEDRQRHEERIESLEKKRPWVEYDLSRQRYIDLKKKKEELGKEFNEAKKKNAPMQKKLLAINTKIATLDKQLKEKSQEIAGLAKQANHKHDALKKLTDDLLQVQEDLNEKKEEEAKKIKKINDWKKQLEAWQRELTEIGDDDNVRPELENINAQHRDINMKMRRIDTEMNILAKDRSDFKKAIKSHKDEIQKLNDLKDQRMRALQKRHRDTYNAVQWLRANKDRFKATIHEPMILTIDMHNREYAKYVETHVPDNDLRAFVCENAEDQDAFMREIRDTQHLRVNAVKSPMQDLESFRPQQPIEQLRRWGFTTYLKDLFEAPEAVMAYLCKQHRVHEVPIGTPYTQEHIADVIASSGLRRFYTADYMYIIRQSRYGNKATSSSSSRINNAQLLYVSIDPTQKRELEQQLREAETRLHDGEERYKELAKMRQELAEQDNSLREKKKQLQNRRNRRQTVLQNIQAKKDSIARNEREALNIEHEEMKTNQKIQKINERKVVLVIDLKDLIQKCMSSNKDKVKMSMSLSLAISGRTTFEEQIRESSQHLQTIEMEYNRVSEQRKATVQEAKRLMDVAKRATGTAHDEELSPALREAFSQFPSTLQEIDNMIHHERTTAASMYETDPRIVEEYRQRKQEITNLAAQVEKKKVMLEKHQQEIADIKVKWLTPLQELISRISDRFAYFFKCMGCAGEVDLYKGENEDDFDKYGIRIRVKFRKNESLRELTSYYQSGGERSVSTILYMMALQELNRCPFRVVDEINQGMDHNNERKVFELVVQTACRDSTSQYFLVTPKLLPNLSYGPKMTVLCVYNGHWMMPHTKWDIRAFCRRRRR
ncbi:structural maintenance of chromosomes protein 5-like, partial [Saccoglossus kowalevskii]|uniref:Structural maintenance of chromosomes protein 5 n=1 Tax=Saccoglossus kowalevskii TaxID=10224 RepID=A0ABM0M9R1_SACKO